METNNLFDFKRLLLLMRRQIFSSAKGLLIAFGGMAGTLLIISLLVAYFNPQGIGAMVPLYFVVLFIGGYIFTSNIYFELHQVQRSYSYLTLPVSLTERLVSGWLITGLLYAVFSLMAMFLIGLAGNLVMQLLNGTMPFGGVFTMGNFRTIGVYLVTHGVFLLGAAYFRKNNFLKTLLALFVISLLMNIYTGLLGWGMFRGMAGDMVLMEEQVVIAPLENLVTKTFPAIFKFIFWYLTIPFFLVTTWFSLKERQV
jgi:hypothetical protein